MNCFEKLSLHTNIIPAAFTGIGGEEVMWLHNSNFFVLPVNNFKDLLQVRKMRTENDLVIRKLSEKILPLLQSFTFYCIAIPEPTTIGQQQDTADSNLKSAIIGTYKLYQGNITCPKSAIIRILLEILMTVPQRNHVCSFQQLQTNLHPTSSNHYSTTWTPSWSNFVGKYLFSARFLKNDLPSGREIISSTSCCYESPEANNIAYA